ncbi:MAG TPA: acireductone synthase [Thermoanaerobaculia bacterium]|nr:acireductone synthase [Thermoanaerobaculia bacterium]
MPLPEGIGAVLTDIEGTTTSISFVYDVLFPYAEARLEEWLRRPDPGPELQDAIARLREEHREEKLQDFGDGVAYARRLMDLDRKSTGLKALQGLIWDEGYRSGEIRSHVFPDVPGALEAWAQAGLRLRVFSSGSVKAQKLLFAHTEHGDLSGLFEEFHDTTTGPKQEASSYAAIAGAFGLPPGEILFLSDVRGELDAAAAAGMRTGMLVRPGNRPADPGPHPTHSTFSELLPSPAPG